MYRYKCTCMCILFRLMIRSLFHGRERLAFIASDSLVVSSTEKFDSLSSFRLLLSQLMCELLLCGFNATTDGVSDLIQT